MFAKYRYYSQLFMGLIVVGTTGRLFFFALQPLLIEQVLEISSGVNIILNTIPSFILFSAYMLLLMFWMELYRAKGERGRRAFLLYTIINDAIQSKLECGVTLVIGIQQR